MAKKKRNKSMMTAPSAKKYKSHDEQERGYIVAKKLLRHFDLDPKLLEIFTKRQRQALFTLGFDMPAVRAEREKTVPRRYVKTMHEEVFKFLKTNFWGAPENQLSYMELATQGVAFHTAIGNHLEDGKFEGVQEETARLIVDKFKTVKSIFHEPFVPLFEYLYRLTRSYSQVNFRLYGFYHDWERCGITALGFLSMRLKIYISVQENESKMIAHNNIERKAFRMIVTDAGNMLPLWILIRKTRIFPDAKKDDGFHIYIQSHVLHRFKERMDVLDPLARNLILQHSLSIGHKIIATDKQSYFVCWAEHGTPIGYFSFFINGDDLVINTFIHSFGERIYARRKSAVQIAKTH